MEKLYRVQIIETLIRDIEIYAENFDEAYNLANEGYHNESYVLDSDDFKDVQINVYDQGE
jgi:hypothetical protein